MAKTNYKVLASKLRGRIAMDTRSIHELTALGNSLNKDRDQVHIYLDRVNDLLKTKHDLKHLPYHLYAVLRYDDYFNMFESIGRINQDSEYNDPHINLMTTQLMPLKQVFSYSYCHFTKEIADKLIRVNKKSHPSKLFHRICLNGYSSGNTFASAIKKKWS